MSFVERIKVTDGTEVAAVTTANQVEVAITNSANVPVAIKTLATGVVGTDQGLVTNTVIHGQTTGGGGGYVDVKVTPSGSLVAEATIAGLDAAVIGQKTMANSLPVVIASDQSVISVNDNGSTLSIDDGDSSITIDNASLTALNSSIVNIGDSILPTKMVAVGGVFGSETRVLQLTDDGYLVTESIVSNLVTHDNIASTANWFSIAGYASSSTPIAVAGGDYSRIWTTLNGAVNIADGNGTISIDDNGGSITVDNSGTFAVQAAQQGTWNIGTITSITNAVSIAANSSVNVSQIGGNAVVTGGTNGTLAIGGVQAHDAVYSANNPVVVGGFASTTTPAAVAANDVSRIWTTLNGAVNIADGNGSITVDGTVSITTNSAVNLSQVGGTNTVNGGLAGTLGVGGTHAHNAVDAGNPLKVGAKAIAHGTNPSAVAAANRTDLYANRHGILWTIAGHPNLQTAEYFTDAARTNDNLLPLIAPGTRYIIVGMTVIASAANSVNTSVRIGFGAAGVPAQGASGADAVTGVILSHPNIPAGSGFSKGHAGGIIGIGGDGEEPYITCSAPTGGSLIVQIDYYTIES